MTFGITLGNALGRTAATLGHAACATANYTGQFGQDVMTGTVESYVVHSERLAAVRAEARRARPMTSAAVAEPMVAGPIKAKRVAA